MSSHKLSMTVLLALSVLSLSACKKGGNQSKTNFARNNNKQTAHNQKSGNNNSGNTAAQNQKAGDGKTNPQTGKDNSGGTLATDDVVTKPGTPVDGAKSTATAMATDLKDCNEAHRKLSEGWKSYVIEVPENRSAAGSGKIKVVYYTLKDAKETLENPVVIFRAAGFDGLNASSFTAAKALNGVDPILIDTRGTGCSTRLPDLKAATASLQHYGSRQVALDAEDIRKALLKDKKWKVMATGTGGLTALRMLELNAAKIEAVSIADYAYTKDVKKLYELRAQAEKNNWEQLLEDNKITDSTIDKVHAALEDEKDIKADQKVKGLALFDVYARMISTTSHWSTVAEEIEKISKGDLKGSELYKKYVENSIRHLNLTTAASLIDFDSSLDTCKSIADSAESNVVSNCRLDQAKGSGDMATTLKSVLKFDSLDIQKVKSQIQSLKIPVHFYMGKLSTMYPYESLNETQDVFDGDSHFHQEDNMGSDIKTHSSFLESLNK